MSVYYLVREDTYRADTEAESQRVIAEAKQSEDYELLRYSSVHKERKQKGEVIDDWYVVKLVKKFDDEKEPMGESIYAKESAF